MHDNYNYTHMAAHIVCHFKIPKRLNVSTLAELFVQLIYSNKNNLEIIFAVVCGWCTFSCFFSLLQAQVVYVY